MGILGAVRQSLVNVARSSSKFELLALEQRILLSAGPLPAPGAESGTGGSSSILGHSAEEVRLTHSQLTTGAADSTEAGSGGGLLAGLLEAAASRATVPAGPDAKDAAGTTPGATEKSAGKANET